MATTLAKREKAQIKYFKEAKKCLGLIRKV